MGQVSSKGEDPDTMDHGVDRGRGTGCLQGRGPRHNGSWHGQGTWDRLLAGERTQTQWIMLWTGDVGQVACRGVNPDTMDHVVDRGRGTGFLQGREPRFLARERTQTQWIMAWTGDVGQVSSKGGNPDTMDHGVDRGRGTGFLQGREPRFLARERTQTQWIMAWTGDVGQVSSKGGNPDTMDHGVDRGRGTGCLQGTQWIMAWTGDVGQVDCKGENPDTMDHVVDRGRGTGILQGREPRHNKSCRG